MKMFYKDPLKAAWMAREHKIRIFGEFNCYPSGKVTSVTFPINIYPENNKKYESKKVSTRVNSDNHHYRTLNNDLYELIETDTLEEIGAPEADNDVLFVVHPDSYPIFEPQVGDIGTSSENEPCKFNGKDWLQGEGCDDSDGYYVTEPVRIIQRNGKTFFMPEVENENTR